MPISAHDTRSAMIACLRYRDGPAAIDWPCAAFGFEKHAVYPNPDGTIAHAQPTFGNGMILLGSTKPDDSGWGGLIRLPEGHVWTFGSYDPG